MEKDVIDAIRARRRARMSLVALLAGCVFLGAVGWEYQRQQAKQLDKSVSLHPFGTGPERPLRAAQPASVPVAPGASSVLTPAAAPGAAAQQQSLALDGQALRGPATEFAPSGPFVRQEASALLLAMGPNMLSGQRAQQSLELQLALLPGLASQPRKRRQDLEVLSHVHTAPGRVDRMTDLLQENLGLDKVQSSRKFFADLPVHQLMVRMDETMTLKGPDIQRLVDGVRRMSEWRQAAVLEITKVTRTWEIEAHLADSALPAISAWLALEPGDKLKHQAMARDISLARVAHATASLDDARLWDLLQRLSRVEVATPLEWAAHAFKAETSAIVHGFQQSRSRGN